MAIASGTAELQKLADELAEDANALEDVSRKTTIKTSAVGKSVVAQRVTIDVDQTAYGIQMRAHATVMKGGFNSPEETIRKMHEALDLTLVGFKEGGI